MPLNVMQAANLLGISDDTVRTAIRSGRLKARTKGSGLVRTHYVIDESAIENYMEQTTVSTTQATRRTRRPLVTETYF